MRRRSDARIGRAAARELEVIERLFVAEHGEQLPGAIELLAARRVSFNTCGHRPAPQPLVDASSIGISRRR